MDAAKVLLCGVSRSSKLCLAKETGLPRCKMPAQGGRALPGKVRQQCGSLQLKGAARRGRARRQSACRALRALLCSVRQQCGNVPSIVLVLRPLVGMLWGAQLAHQWPCSGNEHVGVHQTTERRQYSATIMRPSSCQHTAGSAQAHTTEFYTTPVPSAGLAQQALEADALRVRQGSQPILFFPHTRECALPPSLRRDMPMTCPLPSP